MPKGLISQLGGGGWGLHTKSPTPTTYPYTPTSRCTSGSTGAVGDNANFFPLSHQYLGNTVLFKYMDPYQDKGTAGSNASVLTCVSDGDTHVDMKNRFTSLPNRILR